MKPTATRASFGLESLRRFPPEEVLATLAHIVEMQDAIDGPDVRRQAQAVALVLVPSVAERVDEILADYSPSEPDPAQEIDASYVELWESRIAGDEDRYREVLTRIRALQDAEALRMTEHFERNRPLRPDEAETAISRARALLAEHEDPPSADPATHDAD